MSDREDLWKLLSAGLDLCVRARKLDKMERDRDLMYAESPHLTRSATISMWAAEQYEKDLDAWESEAGSHLLKNPL